MNEKKMQNIDVTLPEPQEPEKKPILLPVAPHSVDRILFSVNAVVLLFVMAVISCFLLFGERPTKSDEENRNLAVRPQFSPAAYFSGTYTAEFAEYYNDTVPMRSFFKGVISDFRGNLGIPYDDGVILVGSIPTIEDPDATQEETTEPPTKFAQVDIPATAPQKNTETAPPQETADPEETTIYTDTTAESETTTVPPTEPPADEQDDMDGEIANNILIVKDRGLMLYGGSKSNAERYANIVNQYKQELGSQVNVYSLVAPTAVSYYLPEKYRSYTASEKDTISYLNTFLNGIVPVDAYSILEEHKNEPIYSRTDHHWQPLGAYYAAKAFAASAGVPFAELSAYETVQLDGYVGTLYGYTNNAVFKDNPEPFVYYKPTNNITTTYFDPDMTNGREASLMLPNVEKLPSTSWYLVFMGGDERITRVTTDCTNGRRLLIIKDSYGNALVPCLTQSFSEIWVVDMRYFEPSVIDFAEEYAITDVLFAMNTFSATGNNAKNLETIMH